MSLLHKLDQDHRLTPWLQASHKDHVVATYAGLVATGQKDSALKYLLAYQKKEEEDKQSYEKQILVMESTQAAMGVEDGSSLPEREYIEWDPKEFIKDSKAKREAQEDAKEDREKQHEKDVKQSEKDAATRAKEAVKKKTEDDLSEAMDEASDLPKKEEKKEEKEQSQEEEFLDLNANDQRMKLKEVGVGEDEDDSNAQKRLALYLAKVTS